MDELGACLHLHSTYVWCCLCLILLLYYLCCGYLCCDYGQSHGVCIYQNKKALSCMCIICEQYLCYVQNVVWISNLHEIFVQINPQNAKRLKTNKFSGPKDVMSTSFPEWNREKTWAYTSKPRTRESLVKKRSSTLRTRIKSQLKQSNLRTSEKFGKKKTR